jgi:hypothetical protein
MQQPGDARLLHRLAAHLDEHLDEMVERLIDSYRVVAGYRRLDTPEERVSLLATVGANERLFIDGLLGRPPRRLDLDRIAEGAIHRLERGIPLADVLQAYRLWTLTTWEEIGRFLESVGDLPWQQTVDVAGLVIHHTELVSAMAAEAYTTEERGIWIGADALRGPQWELMTSGRADPAAVDALQAQRLGDRRPLRMWLLAAGAADAPRLTRNAAVRELVRRWRAAAPGPMIVGVEGGMVALVAPADLGGAQDTTLERDAAQHAAVVRGDEHDTLAAVLAEHAELRRVLDLAIRMPPTGRALTWRDAIVPGAASTADPVIARRLDEIVDVLRRYGERHGTPLLDTVRLYLDTRLNPVAVAQRLYCHRNTVRYRLHRAHELTGLDPADDDDRATLRLAFARDDLRRS